MTTAIPSPSLSLHRIRDVVMPREHGSWSLAFEPVALGCLVAPSRAGGWLALAIAAGFFARRPLRSVWRDRDDARRAAAWVALVGLSAVGVVGLVGAVLAGGVGGVAWLLPSLATGMGFLAFDLRNAGREECAEILGAFTFGWMPAVFAAWAGWSTAACFAVAVLMLGRAVPTVLVVRCCLRAGKTGTWRTAPALIATGVSLVVAALLYRFGALPLGAVALLGILAARAVFLVVSPRPALRARTLGMFEAILGAAFVTSAALLAW